MVSGVGNTTDISGLRMTCPAETIAIDEYLGALCSVEGVRLELMQLDKLFSDVTIAINENEWKKLNQHYDELISCRRIFENSTIANYRKLYGDKLELNVFDQSYYDTIKNNTAKWVMLYGTPEQKTTEPTYMPYVMPDAPESAEPTNLIQETMRRQLQSRNE